MKLHLLKLIERAKTDQSVPPDGQDLYAMQYVRRRLIEQGRMTEDEPILSIYGPQLDQMVKISLSNKDVTVKK
jgi:hypothetical protein